MRSRAKKYGEVVHICKTAFVKDPKASAGIFVKELKTYSTKLLAKLYHPDVSFYSLIYFLSLCSLLVYLANVLYNYGYYVLIVMFTFIYGLNFSKINFKIYSFISFIYSFNLH